MPEEKTGIKIKIFMVAILIFLCAMLGVYSYNVISLNKDFANQESKASTE